MYLIGNEQTSGYASKLPLPIKNYYLTQTLAQVGRVLLVSKGSSQVDLTLACLTEIGHDRKDLINSLSSSIQASASINIFPPLFPSQLTIKHPNQAHTSQHKPPAYNFCWLKQFQLERAAFILIMTCKGHQSIPNQQGMTGEEIATHQQNHSTAKQQFSFPKAQRFQCKTELSDYTFYALPSTKTKVAALIGNQKRTLFDQRSSDSPAPDRYEYTIDGDFNSITKRKTKGYYMALGRSDIKINNFLGGNKEGPNPLKYSNPEMLSALQKHEFSFTRAKKFLTLRKFDMDSVGPGSYKIDSSLEEQKQILSTQLRSLCPKIQDVKVQNRKKRVSSEPPLYCPMVTAKGQALKFNSNKGAKIGMSKRSTLQKGEGNPGPGQYSAFSEFLSKAKV